MRPPNSSGDFVIQGGGNDFANKQKELFDRLSQAAKEFNKTESATSLSPIDIEKLQGREASEVGRMGPPPPRTMEYNKYSPYIRSSQNNKLQRYRCRESIYKSPEGPGPRLTRNTVPDYHSNPHKWTKYSLEDVQNEQMSERSNSEAAFAFLRELKARKQRERCSRETEDQPMEFEETSSSSSRKSKFTTLIPFRKSLDSDKNDERNAVVVERDDRPVFRNSKIVMPEYVVGQKQERKVKRIKKSNTEKIDRSKQLKLAHLEEIDE